MRRFSAVRCKVDARRGFASFDDSKELPAYWRDLERRVSSRSPKQQGPTGRGPRQKTEADHWMASGLYDFKNVGRGETNHERHGRCSTARVREGHMFAARLTYETRLAPLMREDEDLLDLYLLVAPEDNELTALSVWKSPDAFSRVSNTEDYKDAVDALAVHFEIDTVVSDDILAYRITDEDE